MTLQQLRYLIAVAEQGSINAASRILYISQSSLSVAIKELEEELGVSVFIRSSKGISLTNEGIELLGYARQVVEQADLMLDRYRNTSQTHQRKLAISSQHYAFVVQAFIELTNSRSDSAYEFVLRETRTADIIEDVRTFRSDLGVLYLSTNNERVLGKRIEDEGLRFTSLFKVRPHVFVRKDHPLAGQARVRMDDLAPYTRFTFEQGPQSSLYYSEEPLVARPHTRQVVASDRATLTGLIKHTDGFLVSTGIRTDDLYTGIIAIPIECDEVMNVGYITHAERTPSDLAKAYIDQLILQIRELGGTVRLSRLVTERTCCCASDSPDNEESMISL